MTGDTAAVETPVVDNKVEESEKTDKEIIAEEEKVDQPEKEDEPETKEKKDEEIKEEKETKKVVVTWEEDKVYLFQSSRTQQLPSISPQELKLETWLKLHGIAYENVDHKAKRTSKKGTLPFIELNGEEVTDANTIDKLATKFDKDKSAKLTQEQKNVEHAMMKMVENHLYWAIMHWRTSHVDNTLKAYKIHLPTYLVSKLPQGVLNLHFKFNIVKKAKKKVKCHNLENIEQLGKNDLEVLSGMLGEKEFLFGEEPALLDLVVFSHLAQLVMVDTELSCPLRDFIQENCKNLIELVTRVKEKCWGEHWEVATGEKMEHNPHIPKPEPVEKEEVKEASEDKEAKDDSQEKEVKEEDSEKVTETKEETNDENNKEKE